MNIHLLFFPLAVVISVIGGSIAPAVAQDSTVPQTANHWDRHVIDDSLRGADGVRLGDFNDDARMDIVTGWEESGVVRLYLHPGHQEARKPWPAVTVAKVKSPEDAVPVDFDRDGDLDILSCHEGSVEQVIIHWNDAGRQTDQRLLQPAHWPSAVIETLTGQKWMFAAPLGTIGDRAAVAVGSKGAEASITLLLGPPAGSREPDAVEAVRLRDAGWIMSLRAVDMDDDGDRDVVFSDRKRAARGVGWLENPGAPGEPWPEHPIGAEGFEVTFLTATRDRILVATRDSRWLEYHRRGRDRWIENIHPNPEGVPWGKAIEPLPDDRLVMTANSNHDKSVRTPGIWLRENDRWQPIDPTPRVKFDRLECLDLDGDGDTDLMTCEERQNLGVIWYENPG